MAKCRSLRQLGREDRERPSFVSEEPLCETYGLFLQGRHHGPSNRHGEDGCCTKTATARGLTISQTRLQLC